MSDHRIRVAPYGRHPWDDRQVYRLGCTCGWATWGSWLLASAQNEWRRHQRDAELDGRDAEWCPDHRMQEVIERDTDSAMAGGDGPRIQAWVRLDCGCTLTNDLGADAI